MTYNQYFRPKTKSLNSNKDASIAKFADRKEQGIKRFIEDKSASIAISSAFNGANDICVSLLNTNQLTLENYWDKHAELYNEYLERFATAQSEDVIKYKQMVGTLQTGEPINQETPNNEQVIEL